MSAPRPAAGLDSALRPFGESTMLPREAYTSPEVLDWERRHFFAGSWTCLGRTDELREAGTHCARLVGDVGVMLTFGDEGVRALANTCRHRAHELLPIGAASGRKALVCPYHGWSYDLAGRLLAAPRMPADFDKRAWGLLELPAVDWHGWVFVNATGTAAPFAEHLGTLDAHVAPYQPERLTVKARHTYEVAANWKIIAENYHECYHCPQIHPELCAVTPPNSGDNWQQPGAWVGGSMVLRDHAQTMSLDGVSHGIRLADVDPRSVGYLGLFPNVLLSLHPDYVMTHRLEPLAPDRTFVECSWLFDPDVGDPSYAVDFWDITNRQDWAACEGVQRGAAGRGYRQGPLSEAEGNVWQLVALVAQGYLEGRVPSAVRPLPATEAV
jgi:Rieske 2Fe-2S family protein